jgi:hypothetical protein
VTTTQEQGTVPCHYLRATARFIREDGSKPCCGKVMDILPYCMLKKAVVNQMDCLRCGKNDGGEHPKDNAG